MCNFEKIASPLNTWLPSFSLLVLFFSQCTNCPQLFHIFFFFIYNSHDFILWCMCNSNYETGYSGHPEHGNYVHFDDKVTLKKFWDFLTMNIFYDFYSKRWEHAKTTKSSHLNLTGSVLTNVYSFIWIKCVNFSLTWVS